MRTALHLGFGSRAERLIASKRPLIERGGLANRGWKAVSSPLAVNDVEPLTAITMRHPEKPSRAFRFAPRALPLGPAIEWNARAMSIPAVMPADVLTARSLRYIRSPSTRTGGDRLAALQRRCQCVAAHRSSRSPLAASKKAPYKRCRCGAHSLPQHE